MKKWVKNTSEMTFWEKTLGRSPYDTDQQWMVKRSTNTKYYLFTVLLLGWIIYNLA